MIRRLRAFYNPWYIIPFLIWALIGSVLLVIYDKRLLFSTINLHHTPALDSLMYMLTGLGNGFGISLILVCLLLFKSCRNWWYVIAACCCNILPALLVQLLKAIFQSPRPFAYFDKAGGSEWIHHSSAWGERLMGNTSFPSGHSAGIFSVCCFLALILPAHRSAWGLVLFAMALLVGYTRMYLAAHFFADVYVGSLLGTASTLFCFAIMRRWSNQSFKIVPQSSYRSTLK